MTLISPRPSARRSQRAYRLLVSCWPTRFVSLTSRTSTARRMNSKSLFLVAALVAAASAFSASPMKMSVSNEPVARRDVFQTGAGIAAAAAIFVAPSAALAEVEVPAQVTEYEFPSDWGLSFKYEEDAAKVRAHMVVATGLAKGATSMEDFGKNMKKEMVDFVSYYRRFPKVAGKPSFSTLYTSINVLAGHYTSYGYKYPLPEKRRKRLYQEYAEIEKSLKRGR